MRKSRISFLEIKNKFKLFAFFSLLLSIIGAISICFYSFSFNISKELNDYLFQDLKSINIKICDLSKNDSMQFKDFFYEVSDESLSNHIKEFNPILEGANIIYCHNFSKSDFVVKEYSKVDLVINEVFINDKYDFPQNIQLIIDDEIINVETIGSFTDEDVDIVFSNLLYEKYTRNEKNSIKLFFEKNSAEIVYKKIKDNRFNNIDYYGLMGIYDFLYISKSIFNFISIFFTLMFSLVMINFFDIILFRRTDFFSLMQAIGFKKYEVFLSYFLVLFFSLILTTVIIVPLSLLINHIVSEILLTNFENIRIRISFGSVMIFIFVNIAIVTAFLYFSIKKRLKTITIGAEIE